MEALDEALAKKGGNGLISKPIVSKIKVNTAFFTDNAKPLHPFFINPNSDSLISSSVLSLWYIVNVIPFVIIPNSDSSIPSAVLKLWYI